MTSYDIKLNIYDSDCFSPCAVFLPGWLSKRRQKLTCVINIVEFSWDASWSIYRDFLNAMSSSTGRIHWNYLLHTVVDGPLH